ncbi:MAG: RNA polymerase sigma factor [Sneathiellales bacterium]|nr:RNA polymerase sigma factor [Sneathiellales bacterium]
MRKKIPALLPEMKAYATALTKEPDSAEDLIQEAVRKALSAAQVPEEPEALRPWLFRIIRNLHIDILRKEKTRLEYSADVARLSEEERPQQDTVLNNILVRQALIEITDNEREILYLVDILGLKYSEAAKVLEIAEGTVMSRLSRARRSMLERIEQTNVAPLKRKRS